MANIKNAIRVLNEENPGKFGVSKIKKRIWDLKGKNEPGGSKVRDMVDSYNKSVTEYNNIVDKITDTSKEDVASSKALAEKAKKLKKEIDNYERIISSEAEKLAANVSKAEVQLAHREKEKRIAANKAEEEAAKKAAKAAKEKAEYEEKGKGGYKMFKKHFVKEGFKERVKSILEMKKYSGGRVCEKCGSKKDVKDVKGVWKCVACR